MNKELDDMRETIALTYEPPNCSDCHTCKSSNESRTADWGKGKPCLWQYMRANQILSLKTSNGYSIQEMIEFFSNIKCDTQREAVVKRKAELPIENSDVEAGYAGIFNAAYPSVAGANEVVAAERIADALKKYKSRLLAKHFVEEIVQEHHIWCNNFMKPRAGCKTCAELFRKYPYEGLSPDELLKKHFPGVIKRVQEVKDA